MNTAYFVQHPRRGEDLYTPHLLERERPYEVVGEISLSAMDFENFFTDMLVYRRFLEDAAGLCGEAGVLRCLLIRRRGRPGGILVVPEGGLVRWAALLAPAGD